MLESQRLGGELWGVTCFYNPAGYANKLEHLERFAARVRAQGLKLLVVELAFGERPFEVPERLCELLLRRRSSCPLWQKERLLNVGIAHLPPECDRVAWLDADILFENDDWVAATSAALRAFVVVQPFHTACWLPRGLTALPPEPASVRSLDGIGRVMQQPGGSTGRRSIPRGYRAHGHTGFAWAARRTLLEEHGLYDRHLLGNGDYVMAHAMYGDETVWRERRFEARKLPEKLLEDVVAWSREFFASVDGRVGCVPGRVLHLWHGERDDRGYNRPASVLIDEDFDPGTDLQKDEGGCWAWASQKPRLHRWAAEYFTGRREDDAPDPPAAPPRDA